MLIGTIFDNNHFDSVSQTNKPDSMSKIPVAFPAPISLPRPMVPKNIPKPTTVSSSTHSTKLLAVIPAPRQSQSQSQPQYIQYAQPPIQTQPIQIQPIQTRPFQIRSIQTRPSSYHHHQSTKQADPIQTDSTMIKSILDDMDVIKALQPRLCKHLFERLFPSENTQKEEKKEELSEWVHVHNTDKIEGLGTEQSKLVYKKYFENIIRSLKFDRFLKVLNVSQDSKKYISKYIKDNTLINFLSPEEDISKNYDITKEESFESAIYISRKNFLNTILETYPDDTAIVRQFLMDLPRIEIYINGSKVNNIDKMYLDLSPINREIVVDSIKRNKISLIMLVMVMVCQSSFFHSYEHLYKKYMKLQSIIDQNNKKIISGSKQKVDETKIDERKEYEVVDFRERNSINFTISSTALKCSFNARHKILNTKNEETKYVIKTETLFDLDNDSCLIIYEAYKPEKNNDIGKKV